MTGKDPNEWLSRSRSQRFLYRFGQGVRTAPHWVATRGRALLTAPVRAARAVGGEFSALWRVFRDGDVLTRVSFAVMGLSQVCRGQIARGLLYFVMQVIFIWYMIAFGGGFLADLTTLGEVAVTKEVNDLGLEIVTYHDNSLKILLYGVLTVFFIIGFIYTWRSSVRGAGAAQKLVEAGLRPHGIRKDIRALGDEQYYKTLLSVPLLGILIFTVIPIVFMVLVAFTNYDYSHLPPENLFSWVGLDNFKEVLGMQAGSGRFSYTFGELLIWTLTWAVFATFTNYFGGILVALLINKKGIRFKKGFRTILVLTIAVPQFVSLLLASQMFADEGVVNRVLLDLGWISDSIPFLTDPMLARVMVVLINLWIGIPYLMLIATGILMNIPADLYESARIDGAGGIRQFSAITMPYMLFVTGPYLLTSFIGNINNFNVIYLLTGGAPKTMDFEGGAGYTDLLITWLYKLTVTDNNYKMAAVIGIMVFFVVSVISLIVYNVTPSVKNEEDFQ